MRLLSCEFRERFRYEELNLNWKGASDQNAICELSHRPIAMPRYSFTNDQVPANAAPLGISASIVCPIVSDAADGGVRKSAGTGRIVRPLRSASRVARARCHADVSNPIRSVEPLKRFPRYSISSDVFLPPDNSMDESGTPS